jgi:hypothetical protein
VYHVFAQEAIPGEFCKANRKNWIPKEIVPLRSAKYMKKGFISAEKRKFALDISIFWV